MVRGYKPTPLSRPLDELLEHPEQFRVDAIPHELVGRTAPDFERMDWKGRQVRLSDLEKKGPVVLIFYLGYWCDHCVAQLFDIEEEIDKFRELGACVVAVSPDSPDDTLARFRQFGPFHFDVLSDPDNRTSRQYGCFEPERSNREAKQFHGTFVIDQSGKIVWADIADQPFRSVRTLLYEVARIQGRLTDVSR